MKWMCVETSCFPPNRPYWNACWEGEINQDSNARLIRDGNIVYTGKISSIYREKNAAKQVGTGLECGIILKDFADYKKKDIIEAYSVTTFERRI